ncbi:MAG: hypothetical protein D6706_02565 [Chloroflexi bacterium]|nr:MAG: hypothetical protein D6706_02565 [Chloroflexota bacterium]
MPPKKAITPQNIFSLDIFVFLLVVPAHIVNQDAFLVVVVLLIYLVVSSLLPLSSHATQPEVKSRIGFVLRLTCIWIAITAIVILPTIMNIVERQTTPVEEDGYSPANITLSDSAFQTELALAFLEQGRNPYVESYADTPMRFYQWQDITDPNWQDPALHYFVYFPGSLYISYPIYKLTQSLFSFYDQRIVYLILYVCLIFFLPLLAESPTHKLALVSAIGLNPLFTESVIPGMNDVAPLLAIVIAILFLQRKHILWATFFWGIACALKQYTWLMTPFYFLYVWEQATPEKRGQQLVKVAGLMSGIVVFSVLPFALWNFDAFYTDTFAFPAGRAEFLYPIRGFTIGRLLMGAGVIPTYISPFPFQWLQILGGVPVLVGMLWYQYRRGLGGMLFASAVFVFVFGFLSRFFHHNYVGVVLILATLGLLLDLQKDHGLQLLSLPE